MRGRQEQYEAVLDALEGAQQGQGKVILVEGEPGIGKSRLIAVARDRAERRGFFLAVAAADELTNWDPLAPLLAAVGNGPVAYPDDGTPSPTIAAAVAEPSLVRARLEQLASVTPVLVAVDDIHWADPATIHACQIMPRLLSPDPILWIFAKPTSADRNEAALLFDVLERDGAVRIQLAPLDQEAQMLMIGDLLGAPPDAKLSELTGEAAGNPGMLVELLRGLVDQGAIKISGGRAGPASDQIPQRPQAVARKRLEGLSARTRLFLETASVLGRSFRLEDVAEMLGERPGGLLTAVEEALAAGFVVPTRETLVFRHEFVRHAVSQALPQSVQQALDRQFGQILLARGGSAVPAAHHLLNGARIGDRLALAALDSAAAELLPSAPEAAAELAAGALKFTLPSDPRRPDRTLTTVKALTAVGQWEEAETLARSALAVPGPALDSAAMRCALSSLLAQSGRAPEAMAEAQNVLANSDVPGDLRDDATVALLQAWTELRGNQQAEQLATSIISEPGKKRTDVIVAALLSIALVMWDTGRLAEALDLAAQAAQRTATEFSGPKGYQPHLFLVSRLIDIRRLDEAIAIMESVELAEAAGAGPWPRGTAGALRARIALAAGQLEEAAAEAEPHVVTAPDRHSLYECIATSVLATVAVRKGDLQAAAEMAEKLSGVGHYFGSAYDACSARIVAAQVTDANQGPRDALALLRDILDELTEHRWVLAGDPASAPWLVRAALAAGDRQQAERVVSVIREVSQGNPSFGAVRASAEHAEGLLESDIPRLQNAVAQHTDAWARACAAEDLGVLLTTVGSGQEAVGFLEEALQEHMSSGAARDAARIRHRLRRLGVRRKHWATEKRPATGWDSLTDTERAIAELVASGLTNQQVASQLFVSAHTVAFHLRQVFRKLGIRSRVKLTRIALEHTGEQTQDAG
jgi:DNA-binding NarL/FixJ family response regulator